MSAKVVTFAPARERLRRVDPAEAAAGNRALALLHGLQVDDEAGRLRLAARVADAPLDGGWLRFETGVGDAMISPVLISRQPAAPLPEGAAPDLPAALHQLSRLEPLIAAIERVIGLPLDPVGLGPRRGLVFALEARSEDGEIVHAVQLAADPSCAATWPDPPAPVSLGVAGRAFATLRASLEGPRAPVAELPLLSRGDVVVLPRGAAAGWVCTLSGDGAPLAMGFLDLAARNFTVQHLESRSMLETAPRSAEARAPEADIPSAATAEPMSFAPRPAEPQTDAVSTDGLMIRLGVELGEVRLSLKALSSLRPGSVVALEGQGEDLIVELRADGQPLATGRLVSLGDAYGVLVDSVRAA